MGGGKTFREKISDGANTFSEEKPGGAEKICPKSNGARTFSGMNSYNFQKIYRKSISGGLLVRIMRWEGG